MREGGKERERESEGGLGWGGERKTERGLSVRMSCYVLSICVCSVKKEKFWFQIMSILGV